MITEKDVKFGNQEQTAFMRKVYEAQVKWQKNRGKTYYAGVPAGALVTVEGTFKMKSSAAVALKKLLKQAREDLAAAQKKNDKEALKVKEIGISSTYRDPEVDKIAYINAFRNSYNGFLALQFKDVKDRHGEKGLKAMTLRMINTKAPPGFSNHTSGVAVDFKTTQTGLGTLGPSSSQASLWKKSWLSAWLGKNDTKFGFRKLRSEEWHWDYVK